MPKFSIIIPIYNVEQYIRECLQSVVAQTFTDWECIIVNDGSTDNSLSACEEFAHSCRIINQPHGGAGTARNTGLKAAKGQYVFFLDADDWIMQDALERLNKHIAGQDMICFAGQKYYEQDKIYGKADEWNAVSYSSGMEYYIANALRPLNFQFVCVVLRIYKLSFLMSNNLLFREHLHAYEDDLWVPHVCFAAHAVSVIPDNLYVYRIRPNSVMTSFSESKWRDLLTITNQLAQECITLDAKYQKVPFRSVTHHYQKLLLSCPQQLRREVAHTINWQLYYTVSRTKLRHRFNYLKFRLKYLSLL